MRVAIAGSGGIARYLSEELPPAGIEVVILARSLKPHFENVPGVTQVVTDYTVPSVLAAIQGCSALISAILDDKPTFVDVHLRLIEACKLSTTCKRFLPAEYGGDLERYPDQPGFYFRLQGPVRDALRAQTDLEWTLFSCGWLIDLALPRRNRHLNDAGDAFSIDYNNNKIVIPGTGDEPVDYTTSRDAARAIACLLKAPRWDRYTYISGEKSTVNAMVAQVLQRYPGIPVEHRSLYQLIEDIRTADDDFTRIMAEYRIFTLSGAGSLPADKVAEQRETLFKGIKFRTLKDLFDEVDKNPDAIP